MNELWVILTGIFVAASCGILGCFLILRKMAMVGDAISHSVLPGIVIAFLISGSRDSLVMTLGAAVFGLVTVFLIQLFKNSGVQTDASIGVVFTALFAVGIVLVSVYTRQIDLDLDCVLYGEIAFVPFDRITLFGMDAGPKAIWGTGITFFITLLVVSLFYKQFKITSFDPAMAASVGIPVALIHYMLMGLVSLTTVSSFESVGAILVLGMLVVPAATAYLLTERLSVMIVYSVAVGIVSTILGYYAAVWLDASIAGCIVTVAGIIFGLTFIFSPSHGMISKWWRKRKILQEDHAKQAQLETA
ncbi:metal ABC transporter permease [Longirhabdus pacifica]|uniref:metal ABC transporter permease n=1 Tax=Longirhabdus pacifica TaxID=2305227 RepID=UPI0023EA6254|nr:metal ABC transporter permease [Longirhabdus pacifica]